MENNSRFNIYKKNGFYAGFMKIKRGETTLNVKKEGEIFNVEKSENIILDSVHFSGCVGAPAVKVSNSSVQSAYMVISGNSNASGDGGGMLLTGKSNFNDIYSKWEDNKAGNGGGVIIGDFVKAKFVRSEFNGNSAEYEKDNTGFGGAVFIGNNKEGTEFSEVVFQDNAADNGGAVAIKNNASVEFSAPKFAENIAVNITEKNHPILKRNHGNGGAVLIMSKIEKKRLGDENVVKTVFREPEFYHNMAYRGGAAAVLNSVSVEFHDSIFAGNKAVGKKGDGANLGDDIFSGYSGEKKSDDANVLFSRYESAGSKNADEVSANKHDDERMKIMNELKKDFKPFASRLFIKSKYCYGAKNTLGGVLVEGGGIKASYPTIRKSGENSAVICPGITTNFEFWWHRM